MDATTTTHQHETTLGTCPLCGRDQRHDLNGKRPGARGFCVGFSACLIDTTKTAVSEAIRPGDGCIPL